MPSAARKLPEYPGAEPHVLDPRDDSAPADSIVSPEAAGPDAFKRLFPLAWAAFQLLVWAWAAVWWHPGFLEYVGGHASARWLDQHLWVRLLCVPILAPLLLISVFQLRSSRRLTASELADVEGNTLLDSPGIDLTYGIPEGDTLRVPLGSWVMEIGTWVLMSKRRTVARVTVDASSSFSFVARASCREPVLLRGVQQAAMGFAMRHVAETNQAARAAGTAERMAFLGEAPVAIGDAALERAMVLRASQPNTARVLVMAGPVARAIAALEEQGQSWEWTLYPTSEPGRAEMMFECSGSMQNADRLSLVRELMSGALDHLASIGEIGPGAVRGTRTGSM